jgi:hypothetical protein
MDGGAEGAGRERNEIMKARTTRTETPRRPRFIVMSVPHDNGADWFVYDTKYRTSEELPTMRLADMRAMQLNAEHEVH